MSEIDWSLAPEGATHIGTSGNFFKEIDGKFAFFTCGVQHGGWLIDNQSQPNRLNLTPRPEVKPVYTAAMCDAGTLPLVGMECQTLTGKVTVKYIGMSVVVADDGDSEFTMSKKGALHALKPIDTRTDDEKAFDSYWSNLKDCNDVVEFKEALKLSFVAGLNYDWGI